MDRQRSLFLIKRGGASITDRVLGTDPYLFGRYFSTQGSCKSSLVGADDPLTVVSTSIVIVSPKLRWVVVLY